MASDWGRVLQRIESDMNAGSFATWFRPAELLTVADGVARVGVPSAAHAAWISAEYSDVLSLALAAEGVALSFQLVTPAPDQAVEALEGWATSASLLWGFPAAEELLAAHGDSVTDRNRGTWEELKATADAGWRDAAGRRCKGVVLFGPWGGGKTYLACALARYCYEEHGQSVGFVDLDRWLDEVMDVIAKGGRDGRSVRDLQRELEEPDVMVLDEMPVPESGSRRRFNGEVPGIKRAGSKVSVSAQMAPFKRGQVLGIISARSDRADKVTILTYAHLGAAQPRDVLECIGEFYDGAVASRLSTARFRWLAVDHGVDYREHRPGR